MSGDGRAMEAAWAEFVKARAELEAFDVIHHGLVFRSKDVERRAIVGRMAGAYVAYTRAIGSGSATGASAAERRGPRPMVTREEVEEKRAELKAAGVPSGERSIASALGVSRDAVRYALGKDHR